MTKITAYLKEHGPSAACELPYSVNYEERKNGVSVFKPGNNADGSGMKGGKKSKAVYYLIGEHKPIDVIQHWIAHNGSIVSHVSKRALHHRFADYGEEFKQASKEVLGGFDVKGAGNVHDYGGLCPLCDERYEQTLAGHLPECEKR